MKYTSWILSLAVAAAIAGPATAQARLGAPRIVIDGQVMQTDIAPRIVNGQILVPVRSVAEALGASVTWDPQQRTAVIQPREQIVVQQPGEEVRVAGYRDVTGMGVCIAQGRTMVPLRTLAESLGATVRWDPNTNTAYVQTAQVAAPAATVPAPAEPAATVPATPAEPAATVPATPATPAEPAATLPTPTADVQLAEMLEVNLDLPQTGFDLGTPIPLTLQVRNQNDTTPVILQMATGQQFDFIVERDGVVVWRWSQDRSFTQGITSLTLNPNETRSFTFTWNQRDAAGNQVPAGTYNIIGRLTHMGQTVLQDSEQIEIRQ